MSTSASEKAVQSGRSGEVLEGENWLLLITLYGLIGTSSLLLAVVEGTFVYVLLAVVLSLIHALIIGPEGRPLLSERVRRVAAIGALILAMMQIFLFQVHISYAFCHFFILIQLALLYGPHRLRDLYLVQVVVFFEMLVAGIWAEEFAYLPVFLLTGMAIAANLVAVELLTTPGGDEKRPTGPGVEWREFLSAVWPPAAAAFVATALLFVVLPRFTVQQPLHARMRQWLTGFSESVSLREVGMMRESRRIAMRVKYRLRDGNKETPYQPASRLMRGVSMPLYRHGQWFGYNEASSVSGYHGNRWRERNQVGFDSRNVYRLIGHDVDFRFVVQHVELERWQQPYIFALYRWVEVNGTSVRQRPSGRISNDIRVSPARDPDKQYEAVSLVPRFTEQQLRRTSTPDPAPGWFYFWDIPDELEPLMRRTAARIEQIHQPDTDYDRVAAAVNYLTDTRRFTYTFELPDFGDRDPISSFLTETRRGSCEQFSSALALILRAWNIPTRLVAGYKGGQYEEKTGEYIFRDSDAHAWVEVFFTGYGWVSFDPTPVGFGARPQAPAEDGPVGLVEKVRRGFSRAFWFADMRWNTHVVGYNKRHQHSALVAMLSASQKLAGEVSLTLRNVLPGLGRLSVAQLAFLVFCATFGGILALAGFGWLRTLLPRLGTGPRRERTVLFYERLLRILKRKGLVRSAHMTPREFAGHVLDRISGQDSECRRVSRALCLVTESYYAARCGRHSLNEKQEAKVRHALRVVKNADVEWQDDA